jgi:PhzF family phenazine biosynthesis protein
LSASMREADLQVHRPDTLPVATRAVARLFRQVDVFTTQPYLGNPVAVVLEGDGLSSKAMSRIARWTNLSETTFVQLPIDPEADYRIRIFTPSQELPFAGHPTLGTCHAWLEGGGLAREPDRIVQECGAGLVAIRRTDAGLAFAGPPLTRSGVVEESLIERAANALRIERAAIIDAEWVDNGPGWVGILLESAAAVLALEPGTVDFDLGVVGPYPAGSPEAIEVRAFFPKNGATAEDPVTGSLNASLATWLIRSKRLTAPYIASQGAALGRSGRVHVSRDDDGTVWVGGGTITCVSGHIQA